MSLLAEEFVSSEEVCYLLLHEIIDDIFEEDEGPRMGQHHGPREEELLLAPLTSDSPPWLSPTTRPASAKTAAVRATESPLSSVCKRRRLGVSSGAHEQILLFKASLDRAVQERDEARDKVKVSRRT